MHNKDLDFTCTFEDRNLDRVLFDRVHGCISHCECNGDGMWVYYPTVAECNRVIDCCVDRLAELSKSNIDLEDRLEMEWLSRIVLKAFVDIQISLLAQTK